MLALSSSSSTPCLLGSSIEVDDPHGGGRGVSAGVVTVAVVVTTNRPQIDHRSRDRPNREHREGVGRWHVFTTPVTEQELRYRLQGVELALLRSSSSTWRMVSEDEAVVRDLSTRLFDFILPAELLAFLRETRARFPTCRLHVVFDNISPHRKPQVADWCATHDVELVFTRSMPPG